MEFRVMCVQVRLCIVDTVITLCRWHTMSSRCGSSNVVSLSSEDSFSTLSRWSISIFTASICHVTQSNGYHIAFCCVWPSDETVDKAIIMLRSSDPVRISTTHSSYRWCPEGHTAEISPQMPEKVPH